MLCVI
jgi:hypothetical protein